MPDTRFITANLRQLLGRFDEHLKTMPRTPGAPAQGSPDLEGHRALLHGMVLLAVRQAMFDIFDAYTPEGLERATWSGELIPLLQDFDIRSLPIDDTSTAPPPKPVPLGAGVAVYAGAACFLGMLSDQFVPTSDLAGEEPPAGGSGRSTSVEDLYERLRTNGVLEDDGVSLVDLVTRLTSGKSFGDMMDILAVWDRRVAARAKELGSGSTAAKAA
jgi:hypothetical protein